MKHTLLATTALVAMTGAAAAEITVSGTGRIGVRSTEGVAASGGVTTYAKANTNMIADYTAAHGASAHSALANGTAATADMIQEIDADIAASEALAAADTTAATKAVQDANTATLKAIRAALVSTTATVAKTSDTTTAVNRFRISFAGSGETDSGISYGISGRAEQSNSSVAGSQYISGAFGKIKMGDLGGADKDAAGHIAGGVGVSGMGSNNEIAYQAATHNLGYEFSTNGLTFGYSQNTAVQTGSNSALGIKWAGDMGGAGITFGVGQSKVGTATQSTMSVAMSMGGLTVKAISSSNDNGPATTLVAEKRHNSTAGSEQAYVLGVASKATPDTDHTGFSVNYAMDAMTITAYSKTVSTSGAADKDYTGFGITYDMGGATLKAGMVEDNKVSSMDIGVSFSF
jgi:outer membrane protein OmpU